MLAEDASSSTRVALGGHFSLMSVSRPGPRQLVPQGVVDPLVTVVVTAHDYGDFIADCLRSVRAQTYERFECIVVDDCSSDHTPAVVGTLLNEWQDSRFRYVRLPQNLASSEPVGFRDSAGEFGLLDADDLLFPTFIERHLAHHNIETAVAFTSSNQDHRLDGQVLSKSHTDLVSRSPVRGRRPEGKHCVAAPVQVILFPFWHAKNDPSRA